VKWKTIWRQNQSKSSIRLVNFMTDSDDPNKLRVSRQKRLQKIGVIQFWEIVKIFKHANPLVLLVVPAALLFKYQHGTNATRGTFLTRVWTSPVVSPRKQWAVVMISMFGNLFHHFYNINIKKVKFFFHLCHLINQKPSYINTLRVVISTRINSTSFNESKPVSIN